MKPRSGTSFNLNLSGIGGWLLLLAIVVLLSSIGLGWLLKSLVVLVLFLLITPVILFVILGWWLKRNLIEDACPVCETRFIGFNNTQAQCPNCQSAVTIQNRQFIRYSPPGTVDVDVVDVSATDITSSPKRLDGR